MSFKTWLRDMLRPAWKTECNNRLEAWANSVTLRAGEPGSGRYSFHPGNVDTDVFCTGKAVTELDFNPLPYWTEEEINEVCKQLKQSTHKKEVKTMATVYNKNGKAFEAVNFVICVDEGNTQLLTQGKVYANLGAVNASSDNIAVIDDRGLKQNFSRDRFAPFLSEKDVWAHADRDYVNVKYGKLYKVSTTRGGTGQATSAGQTYVHDETGSWMIYGRANFTVVQPSFSEQYLTAKMKAKMQPGLHTAKIQTVGMVGRNLVVDFKVGDEHIAHAQRIVDENDVRFVQVRFQKGGKLYTYKYRGEIYKGDQVVVLVENDNYPELCGTKVLEVVSVLDTNPTNYSLKWVVNKVDIDGYRIKQNAEEKLREAEAALEVKVASMMREDMLNILAARDPEAAALLQAIKTLKDLI